MFALYILVFHASIEVVVVKKRRNVETRGLYTPSLTPQTWDEVFRRTDMLG
jgi:hypothetical protein